MLSFETHARGWVQGGRHGVRMRPRHVLLRFVAQTTICGSALVASPPLNDGSIRRRLSSATQSHFTRAWGGWPGGTSVSTIIQRNTRATAALGCTAHDQVSPVTSHNPRRPPWWKHVHRYLHIQHCIKSSLNSNPFGSEPSSKELAIIVESRFFIDENIALRFRVELNVFRKVLSANRYTVTANSN